MHRNEKDNMYLKFFLLSYSSSVSEKTHYSICIAILFKTSYFSGLGYFWIPLVFPVKSFVCIKYFNIENLNIYCFILEMNSDCHSQVLMIEEAIVFSIFILSLSFSHKPTL